MYHINNNQSVQLPRTLSRPPFVDVNPHAIHPDLSNVPPEYIRRGLRANAHIMHQAISTLNIPHSIPSSSMPKHFSIPLRNTHPASAPTHILALSPSKQPSATDAVPLFPIHSIVLASHCANLPRLPPSPPPSPSTLALPILPLSVPSPAAFPLILTFLYTHSLNSLLSALLPLPTAFTASLQTPHAHPFLKDALASGPKLHQLSTYLCAHAMGDLNVLTGHASHVTACWRNCVALGIFEHELWDALDLAWEVVLGALNLATAAQ